MVKLFIIPGSGVGSSTHLLFFLCEEILDEGRCFVDRFRLALGDSAISDKVESVDG